MVCEIQVVEVLYVVSNLVEKGNTGTLVERRRYCTRTELYHITHLRSSLEEEIKRKVKIYFKTLQISRHFPHAL